MRRLAWCGPRLSVLVLVLVALPALNVERVAAGPAAPSPPTPSASGVTLRWKAREQGATYGYLVYRADRRAGPYLRRNREIVRVPGDAAGEHQYVWVDVAVEAGRTYFYYVDAVNTGGVKERLTGVVEKRVPAAGETPDHQADAHPSAADPSAADSTAADPTAADPSEAHASPAAGSPAAPPPAPTPPPGAGR